MPTHASDAAAAYILELFEPTDTVAILAVARRDEEHPPVLQRIAPAADLAGTRYQAWFRHLNANGYDLFLGMNPLTGEPRSNGRTRPRAMREKQDVLAIRRLQLDLDKSGADSFQQLFEEVHLALIPAPAVTLRSSRHNYQVLWNTHPGWSPEQAEDTMARLADHYSGDHSVADVARVMRLPGMRNKKPGRNDDLATWTRHGGDPVHPDDFAHLPPRQAAPAASAAPPPATPRPAPANNNGGGDNSQSGRDWAWSRQRLFKGADTEDLIRILFHERQDKHNPLDYATRTVLKAAESLRFEGRLPR